MIRDILRAGLITGPQHYIILWNIFQEVFFLLLTLKPSKAKLFTIFWECAQ